MAFINLRPWCSHELHDQSLQLLCVCLKGEHGTWWTAEQPSYMHQTLVVSNEHNIFIKWWDSSYLPSPRVWWRSGLFLSWVVLGIPTMWTTGTCSENALEIVRQELAKISTIYLHPAIPLMALNSPTPKLDTGKPINAIRKINLLRRYQNADTLFFYSRIPICGVSST